MVNTSIKAILVRSILLGCLSAVVNSLGMENTNALVFYVASDLHGGIIYKIDNKCEINKNKGYPASTVKPNDKYTRQIVDPKSLLNVQDREYNISQDILGTLANHQDKGLQVFAHKTVDNKQLIYPIQKIIIDKPQMSYQRFNDVEDETTPPYEELNKNSLEKKELTKSQKNAEKAIQEILKNKRKTNSEDSFSGDRDSTKITIEISKTPENHNEKELFKDDTNKLLYIDKNKAPIPAGSLYIYNGKNAYVELGTDGNHTQKILVKPLSKTIYKNCHIVKVDESKDKQIFYIQFGEKLEKLILIEMTEKQFETLEVTCKQEVDKIEVFAVDTDDNEYWITGTGTIPEFNKTKKEDYPNKKPTIGSYFTRRNVLGGATVAALIGAIIYMIKNNMSVSDLKISEFFKNISLPKLYK